MHREQLASRLLTELGKGGMPVLRLRQTRFYIFARVYGEFVNPRINASARAVL
jgi:hypothetical protein